MRRLRAASVLTGIALFGAACGGGSGSADEFCDNARALDERFAELEEMEFPDPDVFDEVLAELRQLDPPSEISDDYSTLVDGLEAVVEVFADFDPENPDPGVLTELQGLEEEFGDLEEASANVETYLAEECGIDTSG